MASRREQLEFVLDQMSDAGAVAAKAMFGEYGIYCDGKLVALFCDDRLFVKPTPAGRAIAPDVELAPPYSGAKPYLAIGEQLEDREWLANLIRATAREATMSKPKTNAGGWRTCSRGHKFRGPGPCPVCWPGGKGAASGKGKKRTVRTVR